MRGVLGRSFNRRRTISAALALALFFQSLAVLACIRARTDEGHGDGRAAQVQCVKGLAGDAANSDHLPSSLPLCDTHCFLCNGDHSAIKGRDRITHLELSGPGISALADTIPESERPKPLPFCIGSCSSRSPPFVS